MAKNLQEPLLVSDIEQGISLQPICQDLAKIFPFLINSFNIRHVIQLNSLTFFISFLNFLIFFLLLFIYCENPLDLQLSVQILVDFGAKVPYFIRKGEVWRLLTANFLHLNFFHLFSNLTILILLGSGLEKVLGKLNFSILYLSSGVMGFLFSCLGYKYISVGASGAIFGILAVYLAYFLINYKELEQFPFIKFSFWLFIIGIFVSNLIFELIYWEIMDHFNHLGGFLNGFLLGITIIKPYIYTTLKKRLKIASFLSVLALFITTFIIFSYFLSS